jgi:hypothetical protein
LLQLKREFGEANARVLDEPGFGITDHTTRELEEIDAKHKKV